MGIIKILPSEIANRIAAGEVIENPAAVIRELVENSIDANSHRIKVFVKKAGKEMITVSDDGNGMTPEDARVAFQRHATSKISSVEDLTKIHTLGFRGEALASIAAVADVTIVTRTEKDPSAILLRLEGGNIVKEEETARAHGTTIVVENLFKRVPARLKFLKHDSTEIRYIKQILMKILLGNPNIQIELVIDDVPVFRYNAVNNPFERIVQIFGDDFKDILIPVEAKTDRISLSAWVGKPSFSKTNRQFQYLFINRRCVETNFFYPLLNNLYNRILPQGRQPICFIFLTIDPAEVDVNVHPAKREVRFHNAGEVYDFIFNNIRRVLLSPESLPKIRPIRLDIPEPQKIFQSQQNHNLKEDYRTSIANSIKSFLKRNIQTPIFSRQTLSTPGQSGFSTFNPQEKENKSLSELFTSEHVLILGQLFNTYILLECGEDLFILDQHAAHERIIFERLKKEKESMKLTVQHLLIPFQIELDPVRFDAVKKNIIFLQSFGYEIEDFGERTVIIRSVPSFIRRTDDKGLFMDIVEILISEESKKDDISKLTDRILERMACRSAIKAGDYQTKDEIEALLEQVGKLDNLLHCPHGRPFIIKLSKSDIEKLFSRKF